MRPRSWHAANELGSHGKGSPLMVLQKELPTASAWRALATSRDGPPGAKRPIQPIAWSKREGLRCTALSSWASTPPYPISMGEKGSVLHLALITVNEEKSDVERGSFPTLSMQGEGRSHCLQYKGVFWPGAGCTHPLLCQFFLIQLWVQFLGKDTWSVCRNWHGRIYTSLLQKSQHELWFVILSFVLSLQVSQLRQALLMA